MLLVVALFAACAAAALYWLGVRTAAHGPHVEAVRIDVTPGEPLRAVLSDLADKGALADPRIVEWWARAFDRSPRVKVGRYEIPARASAQQVLRQLDEGRVMLETLTVIEGTRYADFRRALATHAGVRQTLAGVDDAELMRRLGDPGVHPEGRFFPDTYRFSWGTADIDILRLAHTRLRERLQSAWAIRASDLPLGNPAEALTLASIVEKESSLSTERPRVAGVFVQRLRRGMRLQSDPTAIYPWKEGVPTAADLRVDTPYNTYLYAGLPPGPICNPGQAALEAAIRPSVDDMLYFVARGDGSSEFSASLDEHNSAVAKYQKR